MARTRDWHIARQYGEYKVILYELKWWHRFPEWLGFIFLEIGARIHHERIGMKISEIGQWGYRVASKAEVEMGEFPVTEKWVWQVHPEFVDMFNKDVEE